jgi:AAA+ superfamily predicted ATPase
MMMNNYLNGLAGVIASRIAELIGKEVPDKKKMFAFLQNDDALGENIFFDQLAANLQLTWPDKLLIILSVTPSLKPAILDPFKINNALWNQRFTEVGGYQEDHSNTLLPTLDTLLFLLCGNDLADREDYLKYFSFAHPLFKSGLLTPVRSSSMTPFPSSVLQVSDDLIHYLLTGTEYSPEFSTEFPAKKLTTQQEWSDLVLDENTLNEVKEIKVWVEKHEIMYREWGMGSKLKPGYRSLFFGPPGTGKTFTVALLGKYTGKEVFRIDLSLVVSKFIGETEKNLSKIFDRAEKKNWILFFDEADALFGKRTNIISAHDRYANQEVSFLLQRVEDYPGVVILATNLKANIDDAFARRFQSIIHFSMPNARQRLLLWRNSFPAACTMEKDIDIEKMASRYELSGGSIINVIQYCCLMAIERSSNLILLKDIESGIRRELHKEGKSI